MFEKSYFKDLYNFTRLKRFKNLLIEDKLNLYANIKLAIKNIHRNDKMLYE